MDNRKNTILTKRIKVYGIVQGVGFRPLVYRIAQKYQINGCVRNVGGFVEIMAQSSSDNINAFLTDLKNNQNGGCEITKIVIEEAMEEVFSDFKIIHSKESNEISIIPPDLSVCPECEKELNTKENRRYSNPFISCMSCGPRYTIIEELPYDRHTTTMKEFAMCKDCNTEYRQADSRRFHAQTISCNDCGPYLIYKELSDGNIEKTCEEDTLLDQTIIDRAAFETAVGRIKSGGIVAVKGIGGYHFVCSPFMEETVENLRRLKGREEKPFAVMFDKVETVRKYCMVSKEEETLLLSNPRPIVLLYSKQYEEGVDEKPIVKPNVKPNVKPMAFSTNKESLYIGAFLPYTPLQILLTKKCGPLIMTSANPSGRPVIKDDEEMKSKEFLPYLNGVLYNQRRIVRSVDDSVAKIINGKPQLIRRSRGYVPYPVFFEYKETSTKQIFSAGGDLKAAFCLYKGGNAVVSQYFGDLEELSVMNAYQACYKDLLKLLKITPNLTVCDLHPNYHSTDFTLKLGLPVLQVQHHHAHVASVMAEHSLQERVIGIAFDGTGYGTDGCIWGGEFLICEGADFKRAAHLSYTPILGGDNSMRDAKKTAACFMLKAGLEKHIEDERKNMIQAAIQKKINTINSSSMGRLFDAVCSILHLKHENQFEGECAALLEREAYRAHQKNMGSIKELEELSFAITDKSGIIDIDPDPVIKALIERRETVSVPLLALGFHNAVADMIVKVSIFLREEYQSNTIALSGGVFQNTLLTERATKLLMARDFCVYTNHSVPPNDGCISLGQTYIGLNKL